MGLFSNYIGQISPLFRTNLHPHQGYFTPRKIKSLLSLYNPLRGEVVQTFNTKTMMKISTKRLFAVALLALTSSCATEEMSSQPISLKDAYAEYFPVGVALGAHTYADPKADSLIKYQFNTITAENCMKPHHIGAKEGEYNFAEADAMLEYAEANSFKVRGHALVWHESSPEWFFAPEEDGSPVTKELVYKRLRTYIYNVVSHFKGRVYCWDVVNEAISDERKEGAYMRENSPWYKLCGEEFIEKAFTFAHEADPDALLFYNDYSVVYDWKRCRVIRMIKELQAKGVPIHGMGIQAHWNIASPTKEELVRTIKEFRELGLVLHITELDMRCNPHWAGGGLTAEDYSHAIYEYSEDLERRQAEQYKMFFETFREYKDDIKSVTFWNLYDGNTWLDRRKGNIGRNYPLLFDDEMRAKSCYNAVTNF